MADEKKEDVKVAKTIKMVRSEEAASGGPTKADVHPDEVANFERGGWRKA